MFVVKVVMCVQNTQLSFKLNASSPDLSSTQSSITIKTSHHVTWGGGGKGGGEGAKGRPEKS